MKTLSALLVIVTVSLVRPCLAGSGTATSIFRVFAACDVFGVGTYVDTDYEGVRIESAEYWLGDPGTSDIVLKAFEAMDGPVFPQDEMVGRTVLVFGTRVGWNAATQTEEMHPDASAWDMRQAFLQAGPKEGATPHPYRFQGDWIGVSSREAAAVSFVSNVVHYLCVNTNLTQYAKALLPPVDVSSDHELFMFKADANMELLRLLWFQEENFLVEILNDPTYPPRFRHHALFQLKRRFDWPEGSTVPEP